MLSQLSRALVFLLVWSCATTRQPTRRADLTTTCTGRPSTDTTVFDTTRVSETPKPRQHRYLPRYPEELRAAGIEGQVVVGAIVDRHGMVEPRSVRVVRGSKAALDREAVSTVAGTLFAPGCRGDSAVRVWIVVPVEFRVGHTLSGLPN
jgi:protein TonB